MLYPLSFFVCLFFFLKINDIYMYKTVCHGFGCNNRDMYTKTYSFHLRLYIFVR